MAHGQGGAEVVKDGEPSLTCNHEAPIITAPLTGNPYGDHESRESLLVPVAFSSKDDGRDAGELAPTLRSMNFDKSHMNGGGQVAVTCDPFIFQTRIVRNGRGQPKPIADALTSSEGGTHADSKPHVVQGLAVRRLTPRECEALQAFPPDWTRYGADGKEISDSARYRMLGNAVTVSVVQWLATRIVEVETC